jgi:hypothetical protein
MKYIDLTYEMIALKYLDRNVDEKWVDWAVQMMMAGFETESLIELAGISKPYNQFELKPLTGKVFEELELDITDKEKAVNCYISFLLSEVLDDKRDLLKTLRDLKDLSIELNYDKSIYDFYSLYFAKEDLNYDTVQWYWEGADEDNIDEICFNYFKKWLIENPIEFSK